MTVAHRLLAGGLALAALWLVSLAAAAQGREQEPVPVARVGVLSAGREPTGGLTTFRETLAELGWVEGRNLHIESRFARGPEQNLTVLATELVDAKVQVILASGHGLRAAKEVATTIPIVGLAVPAEAWSKHVELLKQAVPRISQIAYLVDVAPGDPDLATTAATLGSSLGLTVHPFAVGTADELKAALREAQARRVDAVAVVDTPLVNAQRRAIARFVVRNKLPAVALFSGYPEVGFLMSYGPSLSDVYGRAARHVDRVLKGGAVPADLPVEQPTKYNLVVNLKAAKFLGLTLPQAVVQRANRLIQ
jgi:putative ABC transport system substrate-binding protein